MANGLYTRALQAFLSGDLDWNGHEFRAIAVDAGAYVLDRANHEFLTDLPSAARLSVSAPLTNATVTDGVADADDVTFTGGLATTAEAVVIYRHTGTDATARLVYYGDTTAGGPLAIPATTLDVVVRWDDGPNRIFRL